MPAPKALGEQGHSMAGPGPACPLTLCHTWGSHGKGLWQTLEPHPGCQPWRRVCPTSGICAPFWGLLPPYHSRFSLCSSLLSLLPSQATQTTCFTSPQPCLSPRVQGGREGDATPQLPSPSVVSRAPASLHPAHGGQMLAMG